METKKKIVKFEFSKFKKVRSPVCGDYWEENQKKFHKFRLWCAEEVVFFINCIFRKISSSPNNLIMTLNATRPQASHIVHCMLNYYTRVPNLTPFCSTISCFADNWGNWDNFLIPPLATVVNLKFSSKNRKLQNFKNPQSSFVRTNGTNSEHIWKLLAAFCRMSSFFNFSPIRSYVNASEIKSLKFQFSKFQKS